MLAEINTTPEKMGKCRHKQVPGVTKGNQSLLVLVAGSWSGPQGRQVLDLGALGVGWSSGHGDIRNSQ